MRKKMMIRRTRMSTIAEVMPKLEKKRRRGLTFKWETTTQP